MNPLAVIVLCIAALLITGGAYACCIIAGQADNRLLAHKPPRDEDGQP